MNFEGKKLLFLDGSGLACNAVIRAKQLGIHTIVANFYGVDRSPAKAVADEAWDVNFSDIDHMVDLIRTHHIDGIFVGWTDSHLQHYAEICRRAGIPCCGTAQQFNILSNDKNLFKQECLKYGVPVMREYQLDISLKEEDLAQIKYPVMVKPADGSGSRSIILGGRGDQVQFKIGREAVEQMIAEEEDQHNRRAGGQKIGQYRFQIFGVHSYLHAIPPLPRFLYIIPHSARLL